jgi:hypothetical protein
MNKTIKLLEELGSALKTQNSNRQEFEKLVKDAGLDEVSTKAILESDLSSLQKMLDSRQKIVAFLAPAEDESEDDDDKEQDEDDQQSEVSKIVASR